MKRWISLALASLSFALAAACSSGAPDPSPEPTSSANEPLTKAQCMQSCNVSYTACSSFSDPCLCWPSYASCTKRCDAPPAFDPPEGCDAPAPTPEPDAGVSPPGCEYSCLCSPGVCQTSCAACTGSCLIDPNNPHSGTHPNRCL